MRLVPSGSAAVGEYNRAPDSHCTGGTALHQLDGEGDGVEQDTDTFHENRNADDPAKVQTLPAENAHLTATEIKANFEDAIESHAG